MACVLQFEQLVQAASTIAPHARPLPLYYAAMHAAKTLIASFGEREHPRGHGLHQPNGVVPEEVLEFEVEPHPKDAGVLSGLCAVTHSARPVGRMPLRDLFLSLPDLGDKPHSLSGSTALYVERIPDPTEYSPIPDPFIHIMIEGADLPSTNQMSALYPTLEAWEREDPHYSPINSRGQVASVFRRAVEYRYRHQALQEVAPTYRFSGEHWLIPRIAGSEGIFSPLVTWYCLLFGFSILARYEPDTWFAALDPRRSNAVAIEAALDEATNALPELVWKHIATRAAEERIAE